MSSTARTRADVDLRSGPKSSTSILDRLPADCAVEITEETNGWYHVTPGRMVHGISGYLPEAALMFPPAAKTPIFPSLSIEATQKIVKTVPNNLLVKDFLTWIKDAGKPAWFLEEIWNNLSSAQKKELAEKIRSASIGKAPNWEDWIAILSENNRLEEAVMDEWIVMMEGGKEVYAIRDHYVYLNPLQNDSYYGCALKGQVMRWTGAVRSGEKYGKLRQYYEVDFYRMSRYLHGWFRADIVGDYIYPTPEMDPGIEGNAETVFDLSKPILRVPEDPIIAEMQLKGYHAAQYIDIFGSTGKHVIHYSLCGEFCVAAIGSKDIIPLLKGWHEGKYPRTSSILNNPHEGTCAGDLQNLLSTIGLKGDIYSSMPTTPQKLKDRLVSGQFMIAGCGINSGGKVKADGKIRHWVVLEDIIPVGNGGWVRVYNPFYNRDEVYSYNMFLTSVGIGAGLWVTPTV